MMNQRKGSYFYVQERLPEVPEYADMRHDMITSHQHKMTSFHD